MPRYGSHIRAGAANGRRTKARRKICRAAAPSATQRGKAGTQIAGRAGCLLQQHIAYPISIIWAPADPALWPVLSPRVRCLRFAARLPCALLQVLHCGTNDAGSHACCRTCAASGFAITAPGAWHAPLGHVDRVQPDDDDGCLWWRDGRAAPAPREPAQVLGAPRCGRTR